MGGCAISKRTFTEGSSVALIESIRVDDIPSNLKWDQTKNIAVLKMDIEGFELHGLLSMWKLLQTKRIRVLVMEFSPCDWSAKDFALAQTLIPKIADFGYQIFELQMNGKTPIINDWPAYMDAVKRYTPTKDGLAVDCQRFTRQHLNTCFTDIMFSAE